MSWEDWDAAFAALELPRTRGRRLTEDQANRLQAQLKSLRHELEKLFAQPVPKVQVWPKNRRYYKRLGKLRKLAIRYELNA